MRFVVRGPDFHRTRKRGWESFALTFLPSLASIGSQKEEREMEEKTGATPSGFEEFWKAYPRKVGRGRAAELWKRLKVKVELSKTILAELERQKKSHNWTKANGQYIPHPSTWLAQKRWEDEPDNCGSQECKRNLPSAAEVRRVIREHRDRMIGYREADADAAWERIFRSELQCSYQDALEVLK